jgi:hypothetical protein
LLQGGQTCVQHRRIGTHQQPRDKKPEARSQQDQQNVCHAHHELTPIRQELPAMPKLPKIVKTKIVETMTVKTEKPLTIKDTKEHKGLLQDVKSKVEIII